MTTQGIMEAMGNMTTISEADAMAEILAERGITDLADISDEEFFALIPAALDQAKIV